MRKVVIAILATAMSVSMALTPMAAGWFQGEDGQWRYQRKTGEMAQSMWAKSGDNWFYLKEDGTMAVNQWIYDTDGACYYVDANGAMMRNTVTPDGYYVGVNGKWVPEQTQAAGYTPPETVSVGMQNALKKAESYMRWANFSKKELFNQLKYEGFSDGESQYGSEMIQIDWNEACAKKAKSYMSWASFSRKRLVEQLQFDGFTDSEIAYGVTAVGY